MELPYGLKPKKKKNKNKSQNNNNINTNTNNNNINNSNNEEENNNITDSNQKIELLIFSIMEQNGYYPKTSYFTNNSNKNDKIPSEQNFEKIFPKLTSFFKDIDKNFSEFMEKKSYYNYNTNMELRYFILREIYKCNSEITNFIGYYWDTLDKKIKSHSTIFLYMVNEYIKKDKVNNYDKNILFWTILFHDIGKFHVMNKFYKEDYSRNKFIDKSHPFKSAIIFIQTLLNQKLIYFKDENEKDNFVKFFEKEFTDTLYKSFEEVKKKDKKTRSIEYNISFKNFDNIEKFLLMLKDHEENKWIYDIIILIIFHHSLPNDDKNGKHLHNPLLDKKYIKELFDLRLLELMRIILIYDSSSHCLFEGNWEQKIDKHFDQLIKELFS